MSESHQAGTSPTADAIPTANTPTTWQRLDTLLDQLSDRLNPILVKEARQAMKSRQFVITFALLLICAWAWSFLGVSLISPGVYYAPGGRFMLIGYYYVLAFPLLVIVPFSAFRSLAAEREDGTYELLSISTLTAWQIVGGKLGSTLLQMLIYLSAISPCVAFTYLLRGVDILLLFFVLVLVFLVSLFLSALGLLLATLTRAKHWQVVLSVGTIVGLIMAFIYFSLFVTLGIVGEGLLPVDQPEFWVATAAILTGYASIFVLIVLAASAQISFASDNRSTRLRIAMLAQYILLVGWIMWFWFNYPEEEVLYTFLFMSAFHWFLMGSFMAGESPQLSPRVKRQLPKSFLGRVFLTWFFPGPGKGYFFSVASMFSAVIVALLATAQAYWFAGLRVPGGAARFQLGSTDVESLAALAFVLFCYLVIYLGTGRLIVQMLAHWTQTNVVLSLLVNIVLVALGVAVPLTIQFSLMGVLAGADDYTPLQASNVFWTIIEAVAGRDIWRFTFSVGSWQWPIVPVVLCHTALVVFALNLIVSAREIVPAREAVPPRVQQDEFELHPKKAPPPPKPSSPWDGDPAGSDR